MAKRRCLALRPNRSGGKLLNYKNRYDIFICGGSEHFTMLRLLLPRLYPFGRVHLASIALTDTETEALSIYCDIVHKPQYDADGYLNFNLFCIRDINRLAQAPFFIKLDADVSLPDNWIESVERGLDENPDAVLLGIKEGVAKINIDLSGPLVRKKLGKDIRVTNGRKIIGGFYAGRTAFFKQQDRSMQILHELFYCFEEGRRHRAALNPKEWPEEDKPDRETFYLKGDFRDLQRIGNEDTLRSLVVHAAGAGDRMFILDSKEITVPHGPGFGNTVNW